jgi:hypothetical protein
VTASTTTHSQPRKQATRPTLWRSIASYYVDLLICGFLAWIVCFTFDWKPYWFSMALFLWVGEALWCRDRLQPTAGEYCVGIRYLTSSSSQVVADIKVVHNKLKLNGFLIAAGVLELTLAILLFTGWTLLSKAAFWGITFSSPFSMAYWALTGLAFFICSGYLLSGSKMALGVVPIVHVIFGVDLFLSGNVWNKLIQNDPLVPVRILHLVNAVPFSFLNLFALWTLFVVGALVFSRKHLVN